MCALQQHLEKRTHYVGDRTFLLFSVDLCEEKCSLLQRLPLQPAPLCFCACHRAETFPSSCIDSATEREPSQGGQTTPAVAPAALSCPFHLSSLTPWRREGLGGLQRLSLRLPVTPLTASSLSPSCSTPVSPWGTEDREVSQEAHGFGAEPEMPFCPWQNMSRNQNLCKQSKQKLPPPNHSICTEMCEIFTKTFLR